MRGTVRRRKLNLLAESPFCWYCGVEVFDHLALEAEGYVYYDLDNVATVEHLFSVATTRAVDRYNGGVCVLACYRCNNDRSTWECKYLSATGIHFAYDKEQPRVGLHNQ